MTLEPSGFLYPNKMARIHVLTIEETIGHKAMMTVFETANIPESLYPPANNFAKGFDFVYYGAIGAVLENMYGYRGVRGLMLHSGRAAFDDGLAQYGSLLGSSELAFKAIPIKAKLKIGIKAVAEAFNKFSDQITEVSDDSNKFIYTIHRCPACWDRSSSRPVCFTTVGLLEAALKWVSGGATYAITEVDCCATGSESCVFHIQKEPVALPENDDAPAA